MFLIDFSAQTSSSIRWTLLTSRSNSVSLFKLLLPPRQDKPISTIAYVTYDLVKPIDLHSHLFDSGHSMSNWREHLVRNCQKGERLKCLHTFEDPFRKSSFIRSHSITHPFKDVSHLYEDLVKEVSLILEDVGDISKEGMPTVAKMNFRRNMESLGDKPLVELSSRFRSAQNRRRSLKDGLCRRSYYMLARRKACSALVSGFISLGWCPAGSDPNCSRKRLDRYDFLDCLRKLLWGSNRHGLPFPTILCHLLEVH